MTARKALLPSLDEAQTAVEALVAALTVRLGEGPSTLQVDDLIADYRAAVGDAGAPVEAVVHQLVGDYSRDVSFSSTNQFVINNFRARLSELFGISDETFVEFDQSVDLTDAESALVEAEQEQQAAMAVLEDAVARADVEEVVRLRTQVEVAVPQRVEAARLAVLDLQVARAEQFTQRPIARRDAAAHAVQVAQEACTKAAAAMEAAQDELQSAAWASNMAEHGVISTQRRLDSLTAQRDEAARAAARDTQQRFRRLAGLPDEQSENVEQPVEQPRLMLTKPTVTFTYNPEGEQPEPQVIRVDRRGPMLENAMERGEA